MRIAIRILATIMFINISYSCTKTKLKTSIVDLDVDNDTRLSRTEFHTSFRDLAYYDLWDVDRDSTVNENEWSNGMRGYQSNDNMGVWGKYADWDKDMNLVLDKDELSKQIFDMYDVDKDGFIENNEFEKWYFGIDSVNGRRNEY